MTSDPDQVVDGYIIVQTETGMPELQARRMVRLDNLHYLTVREDDEGTVYRLAETFFVHELPCQMRIRELLQARKLHHQRMQKRIEQRLSETEELIERARKEDR